MINVVNLRNAAMYEQHILAALSVSITEGNPRLENIILIASTFSLSFTDLTVSQLIYLLKGSIVNRKAFDSKKT